MATIGIMWQKLSDTERERLVAASTGLNHSVVYDPHRPDDPDAKWGEPIHYDVSLDVMPVATSGGREVIVTAGGVSSDSGPPAELEALARQALLRRFPAG